MIDWAKVDTVKAPQTMGQEIYRVRVSEISPNGLFSIVKIAEYLQESAFRNSAMMNLGMDALSATKLGWVLARLSIFVRHYPRKNDSVIVETWYAGQQGPFGQRFFRIRDANNMVIATAVSTFALFNLEERAIAPWPDFVNARMPEAGPCPIDFQRRTIERPLLGMPKPSFSPRLGDIDINNHVNNTHLIDWVLSAAAEDAKHPYQPASLDIIFKNECRLKDIVQPEVEQLNKHDSCVLLTTLGAKELVRAYITR